MTAITAITAQNTVEVAAVHPLPRGGGARSGAGGGRRHRGGRGQGRDARRRGDDRGGARGARAGRGGAGGGRSGDGVRERLGAAAGGRQGRPAGTDPPARHRGHTQPARGAGAGGAPRRAGRPRAGQEDPRRSGRRRWWSPGATASKGRDLYYDGQDFREIAGERHPDGAAHGSGCTHSSALAAFLAHGHSPLEAARRARVVAADAVRDGLRSIGGGAGPVDALGITARLAGAAEGTSAIIAGPRDHGLAEFEGDRDQVSAHETRPW